jgi:DNA polymerase-3 subunit epsilon
VTGFAVFDLETTGVYNSDRLVEIGVVLLDEQLRVEHEWCTLINPHRDLSAGHIHGIVASDVHDAPDFAHVAEHIAALLDQRVVVAHNVTFDLRMLAHELARAKFDSPGELLVVDTLRLARAALGGPASLQVVCEYLSIDPSDHEALGDARAAAQILTRLVEESDGRVLHGAAVRAFTPAGVGALEFFDAPDIGQLMGLSQRYSWTSGRWLTPAPSHTRSSAVSTREYRDGYLARLVADLPPSPALADADLDPYLLMLEEALLDRLLMTAEAESLAEVARSVGLSAGQVQAAHLAFLSGLAAAATADGVVTDHERADLFHVARLLGLDGDDVETALASAARPDAIRVELPGALALAPGDRVVFTGEASVPRSVLEAAAVGAGLSVTSSVSKKTRVVVMADPLSESTKARRARELGVPVIAEQVFQHVCAQMRASAGLPPAPTVGTAGVGPPSSSVRASTGSGWTDRGDELDPPPFEDGVRMRSEGVGISIEFDVASFIDPRLLDRDVSEDVKREIIETMRAMRRMCGGLSWDDIPDDRHRLAHEALDDQGSATDNAPMFAAVDELVAAGCSDVGNVLLDLPYRVEESERAEFEARMHALRHFRAGVPTTPEMVRKVAQNLCDVAQTKDGRLQLLDAERELGPWLRLFAPCDVCRERDQLCDHLDLASQLANVMAWDAKPGEFLSLAHHLALPEEGRPVLMGRVREQCDLLFELGQASPAAQARLMEAVAAAAEQELPDFAISAYEANLQSGLGQRWEFDRLSLLLERDKRYADAIDVAERGLRHPDCGATRGERLRKRIERCQRKADAPVARPAVRQAEAEETLTCGKCGCEFTRLRSRGRKPKECPTCRE